MAIGVRLDYRKNAALFGDGFFYKEEIVLQSGQIDFRNGWTAFHGITPFQVKARSLRFTVPEGYCKELSVDFIYHLSP
jgi:hypothetical protein